MRKTGVSRDYISALGRGLAVLECVGRRAVAGNGEIAGSTNLPNSTVARLTSTLLELGYLEIAAGRRYQLTSRALDLGYAFLERHDFRERAHPLLRDLSELAPLAASLVVPSDTEMVYIAQVRNSAARLTISAGVGYRVPMATTAGGKAYLAALPLDQYKRKIAQLERCSEGKWIDVLRGIEQAKLDFSRLGFCSAMNVNGSGINAVSSPLRTRNGGVHCILTCAGPAVLLPPDLLLKRIGPKLVQARVAIEAFLP